MKTDEPSMRSLSRGSLLAMWGISAVVFGYCVSRAIGLSLTHDEALTYVDHARATLPEILYFDIRVPSNNHLLNTLLIKALTALFGNAEIVLRAPALAGLVLFLFGTARVFTRYLSGPRLVLGFALVTSNAYLLDFFGCARGYGLALGFTSLATAAYLDRVTDNTARNAGTATAVFAGLAVLANLAFATLFLAFAGVLVVVEAVESKRSRTWRFRTLTMLLAMGVLLAIVFRPSVLDRIRVPLGKWGGDTGIWADTIPSLVANALYLLAGSPSPVIPAVRGAVLAVAIVALLFAGAWCARRWARAGEADASASDDDRTGRALLALVSLVALVIVGIRLQVRVFEMPFPVGRGVIYLVPLFSIGLLLVWERGAEVRNTAVRYSTHVGCALVFATLLLLQLAAWNRTHMLHWRYDADTRAAMGELARLDGEGERSLGVHWPYEPSTNYYRIKDGLTWLRPIVRERALGEGHDYYLVRNRKQLEELGLALVREFEVSGTCLAVP